MTLKDPWLSISVWRWTSSGWRRMNPQLGTQSIMSPEQYLGQGIGPASDRYVIGLIVYRYLSGQYPGIESHLSNTTGERHQSTSSTENTSRRFFDGLAKVVHKMLQRDPNQRYPRCIEFLHACLNVQNCFEWIHRVVFVKMTGLKW